MIDLSKYEGHTPGPWWWNGLNRLASTDFEVLEAADDGRSYGMHYAEIRHHYNQQQAEVNARLIADAPALLAEVKRLRADLTEAAQVLDSIERAIGMRFAPAEILDENSVIRDEMRAVLAKHGARDGEA